MSKKFIPVALILTAAGLSALGYGVGKWRQQNAAPPSGVTLIRPAQAVTAFSLRDQDNRPFGLDRLAGKWSFLFFGYTHCPDICPAALSVLKQVHNKVNGGNKDVQTVFISVDPKRDTPAVLKRYVGFFDPGFIGVTGTHDELKQLTKPLGVYYETDDKKDKKQYDVHHTAAVFLVDPEKRVRAIFSSPQDPGRLAQVLGDLKGG